MIPHPRITHVNTSPVSPLLKILFFIPFQYFHTWLLKAIDKGQAFSQRLRCLYLTLECLGWVHGSGFQIMHTLGGAVTAQIIGPAPASNVWRVNWQAGIVCVSVSISALEQQF